MEKYLVIDTFEKKLRNSCETIEQAEYMAKIDTVNTNHPHIVAELKIGFITQSKELTIQDIKEQL